MKKRIRALAAFLSLLIIICILPISANAQSQELRVGDLYTVTYSVQSPVDIINAQIELEYSENLRLVTPNSDYTDLEAAFPVVHEDVVINTDEEKHTVYFNLTSADKPYAEFTADGGAVLYSFVFEAIAAGEASVTPNIVFVGGNSENDDYLSGVPVIENNELQEIDGQTATAELTESVTPYFVTTFNDTVSATAGEYVYYAYRLTSNLSLINAQVSINYTADLLELTNYSFPNLDNAANLESNNVVNDNNGTFLFAFSDYQSNNFGSFENGADLVVLTFKIIGEGAATATADVSCLDGKNSDGDTVEIVTKNTVQSGSVYEASYKIVNVIFPEENGFTVNGELTAKTCDDYTFTISVHDYFNDDNMTVTVNDEAVVPDENGVYTVSDITGTLRIKVSGVETTLTLGDADNNGLINSADATLVLQRFAGIISDADIFTYSADVDGNGVINAADASAILQYYARIIENF